LWATSLSLTKKVVLSIDCSICHLRSMSEPTIISVQIGDTSREIAVPRSWDDLDNKKALLYYNTLFTTSNTAVQADAFTAVKLISITGHILGMGADFLPRWESDCIAEDAELGHLTFLDELKQVMVPALKGLFEVLEDEDGGTSYAVKYNRTKNLWPVLTHTDADRRGHAGKTTWYYAPKDGLDNLSLYELAYTFSTYEAYVQSGDEKYVHQLIGALYRPSRPRTREETESAWHGDRRQPLRHYEGAVDRRARMAATLPVLTRRMIVFWFASCREAIAKRYPKVFVKSEDASMGRGSNYGWGAVLLGIAGGPVGLDAVADQHHSNALTWLSMKEDERRRMEEEMERAKNKRNR